MTKPKPNTIEVIKFSIAIAVASVAAALWFPGVAQERVAVQVVVQEKVDKRQDKNIEKLDTKVDKLITAQAVATSELRATREAVRDLILEIRKDRID